MNEDERFIHICIELAQQAGRQGDFPIGSVVVRNGKIISARYNESLHKNEVYRHAEILALVEAQKKLNSEQLSQCVLYTTVEPCAMCSFAIQELNIRKVIFALSSPIMGGYTKWKILQDEEINTTFPRTFGCAPAVVTGVLRDKVVEGWKNWDEKKWYRLINKGVFL